MNACVRAAPPAAVAVGVELRAARLDAKWGVRELARRVSMNPARVSSWELGERIPPPDMVSFVAGVLRLTKAKLDHLRQLAADARQENYIEPRQDAAARLTAVYERLSSHIIEWAPLRLHGREQQAENVGKSPGLNEPALAGDASAIRDLFVGARSCRNPDTNRDTMIEQNELLLRLHRQENRSVRLVTDDVGDLPAFTVYRTEGRTPTVALRHAGCSIYLTAELATAAYIRAVRRFASEALSPALTAATIETALCGLKAGR
ncbi:Scr1 family TA system antitoxin-like transcriptional regulator [Amycolatopsis halotolerans]|uniref:Scr1 family TA system antitoxin-like transcriptional regulator n=1 Tax=Amycolatopsis halotolerans TaxID=330083 RepID=A0ABV7QD97_9PSEU